MTFDSLNRDQVQGEASRFPKRLVPIFIAIAIASPLIAAASEPISAANQRPVLLATTPYFTVRSYRNGPDATEVASHCETLRQQIHKKWLDNVELQLWQPRCDIVLHATRSSYIHAVGTSGGQTSGSSLIKQLDDRVVSRRIDLLVDRHGAVTALPHELTHIVLADEFGGQQPPPWLDEGIASLADSQDKLDRHQRDCDDAVRRGTAFPMIELLTLDRLSSSAQFAAFYGQSVSLVRFLCDRDEPVKLLPFAKIAMEKGYDEALRSTYQINGVGHLQRLWLETSASSRRKHDSHLAASWPER